MVLGSLVNAVGCPFLDCAAGSANYEGEDRGPGLPDGGWSARVRECGVNAWSMRCLWDRVQGEHEFGVSSEAVLLSADLLSVDMLGAERGLFPMCSCFCHLDRRLDV